MDLEQKISHGIRAAEVLQNEAYLEAHELIKMELMNQWQQSPARDVEGREKLYLMLAMLSKVQAALQTTMETGKLSSKALDYRKSLMQRGMESVSQIW